MHLQPFINMRL